MPAKIYKYDLYGKRQNKLDFLSNAKLSSMDWQELPEDNDVWRIEGEGKTEYQKGFSVAELFINSGVGIVTAHDDFVIDSDKNRLLQKFEDFRNTPRDENILHQKFNVNKKTGWNILEGYDNINREADLSKFIQSISYRPFDNKYIFLEDRLVWRTVMKVNQHFLKGENLGLVTNRQVKAGDEWQHIFISSSIVESSLVSNKTGEIGSLFPLYLYDDFGEKIPNLKKEIWEEIEVRLRQSSPPGSNPPFPISSPPGSNTPFPISSPPGSNPPFPISSPPGSNPPFPISSPPGRGQGEGKTPPLLLEYAREMRKDPTGGEKLMWWLLRGRRFLNLKFRRQHPIEKYIIDFYCHELQLAIEIDGPTHDQPEIIKKDNQRTMFLESKGIKVYRIKHDNLLVNTDTEITRLSRYIESEFPRPDPLPSGEGVSPEDILDYVYGYLHLPSYRSEYSEFLKTDFPRVPYPRDKTEFEKFVDFGKKLRDLHLMTDPEVDDFVTTFPVGGSDEVESLKFATDEGKVWINAEQYFGNVPEVAWKFYIGGYQPAQKYLKDRKGNKLSNEEIEQYQRIIKVLLRTHEIMEKINLTFGEAGV